MSLITFLGLSGGFNNREQSTVNLTIYSYTLCLFKCDYDFLFCPWTRDHLFLNPRRLFISGQAEVIYSWTRGGHSFLKTRGGHYYQRQADDTYSQTCGWHLLWRSTDVIYYWGNRCRTFLKQGLHSFKRQKLWEHQDRVIFFSSTDSLIQEQVYSDLYRTLWQDKVNKRVTPNSK